MSAPQIDILPGFSDLRRRLFPSLPGRPKGVTALSVVHYLGSLAMLLVAAGAGEDGIIAAPSRGLLGVLFAVGGYGLWKLQAWAWWLVFVNSAIPAAFATALVVSVWLEPQELAVAEDLSVVLAWAAVATVATGVAAYLWSRPIRSAFAGHAVARRERPPQAVLGLGLATVAIAAYAGYAWGGASESVTVTVRIEGTEGVSFTGEFRTYEHATGERAKRFSGVTPATFRFKAPVVDFLLVAVSVERAGPTGSLIVTLDCPGASSISEADPEAGTATAICVISGP